jgi:hypothetical protein
MSFTHVEVDLVELLEPEEKLAPLAADLDDTVDGNLLIDAVKLWKSASPKQGPKAISPYFREDVCAARRARCPRSATPPLHRDGGRARSRSRSTSRTSTSSPRRNRPSCCRELLAAIAEEKRAAVGPDPLLPKVQPRDRQQRGHVHAAHARQREGTDRPTGAEARPRRGQLRTAK